MTRNEVKSIVKAMRAQFGSLYQRTQTEQDLSETINSYYLFLADCNYKDALLALNAYMSTGAHEHAPNASQLKAMLNKPKELARQSPAEAWQVVRKAISRGNYYAEQDYDSFAPEIQRAVGSPEQLRIWAQDVDFNEGVESSNFFRRYSDCIRQADEYSKLPPQMQVLTDRASTKLSATAHPLAVTDKRQAIEPGVAGTAYLGQLKEMLE